MGFERRLVDRVSAEWMDHINAKAIIAVTLGGKLIGAGGGGSLYFLAPPTWHAAIKEALFDVRVWVLFTIAQGGLQVVFLHQ